MSLNISYDQSLKHYNSFGFDYSAEYFCILNDQAELFELMDFVERNRCQLTMIGAGSNLVLKGDVKGLVVVNNLKGRKLIVGESPADFTFELAAGEVWHDAVEYSVRQGLYGIENLALIPGTAGAAPVQNIGAYGVEIKDALLEVEVFDIRTRVFSWVSALDCDFSYRESRFKHEWKDSHIVTKIRLKLSTVVNPKLSYFSDSAFDSLDPSALEIFEKVSTIRREKLPDPKRLGNAGSFFKNPIVTDRVYQDIKKSYPNLVAYPYGVSWKLAAGWLIDQAGWKGKCVDGVGVYDKQALVLVNYDNKVADNLLALQDSIVTDVQQKFDVVLEREPIALG
ncbi:UDP-N-acetylmuramate dehydrogenase [Marinomonas sp. 15G1-11]|uniref:UDP-N-acetylenolpyruvoylglucosamine reductase n=1 Tax=Marinomonas phaeophyticola TaxID=3004091 RepID=A0ABT4JPK4_9GAMM|nr:UDP-N-acetylmuramate dehydrogenase [Marinomonas sp. 15G1-11]MCZ2720226.1 UDP-N-acetylmuramate dehydrogenase [Marinomonas sp. 15G1-11]